MSESYPLKYSVGQGRVLSAWLFVVYIDDLHKELQDTRCGLMVSNTTISVILLVDDATYNAYGITILT